jgi:small subunit ribosomal protein S8
VLANRVGNMAALDIISNGFNCIMSGQRARKNNIKFPTSKILIDVIDVMLKKNYIVSYEKINQDKKNYISIQLKYNVNREGVIYEIKRYSKSSRRIYCGYEKIPRVNNGYATVVISTSKGIMTGKEAKEQKLGGEVICHIF